MFSTSSGLRSFTRLGKLPPTRARAADGVRHAHAVDHVDRIVRERHRAQAANANAARRSGRIADLHLHACGLPVQQLADALHGSGLYAARDVDRGDRVAKLDAALLAGRGRHHRVERCRHGLELKVRRQLLAVRDRDRAAYLRVADPAHDDRASTSRHLCNAIGAVVPRRRSEARPFHEHGHGADRAGPARIRDGSTDRPFEHRPPRRTSDERRAAIGLHHDIQAFVEEQLAEHRDHALRLRADVDAGIARHDVVAVHDREPRLARDLRECISEARVVELERHPPLEGGRSLHVHGHAHVPGIEQEPRPPVILRAQPELRA